MRRIKKSTIERGHLTGSGSTKAEAKADLDRQIDHLCSHGTLMEVRFGFVIVISPMAGAQFGTRIVSTDTLAEHGRMLHFTGVGGGSMHVELRRARLNVAQSAWMDDLDDELHVSRSGLDGELADELRRWIRFQRSYLALKAEGKTDSEAHRLACSA